MTTAEQLEEKRRQRQLRPLCAAGFLTAFGAHAVAANLGGYASGHHASLWQLGILLASTTAPRLSGARPVGLRGAG